MDFRKVFCDTGLGNPGWVPALSSAGGTDHRATLRAQGCGEEPAHLSWPPDDSRLDLKCLWETAAYSFDPFGVWFSFLSIHT